MPTAYSAQVSNLEQTAPPEGVEVPLSAGPVVLLPREVPLGGPRALLVRRTLPHRDRRMIGAWCFVDHYGPVDLTDAEGMRVPPHPHTGLQTVSWLIDGAILHTDSVGSKVEIQPRQLNLMTAGSGISHSEDSLAHPTTLHGIQLWVALPAATRHQAPHFEHHAELPRVQIDGAEAIVFMGELAGASSPAATYSPLVGAQLTLRAGATVNIPTESGFEYGVLAVRGNLNVDATPVPEHALLDLGAGHSSISIRAEEEALFLVLGGEPFSEEIVMWWNFIGRDHEEIAQMRAMWQARDTSFGNVDYHSPRLEAPELPNTRLKARGSRR